MKAFTRALNQTLRVVLALSLAHAPVAFAEGPTKPPAWGRDGWPSVPSSPRPDQEMTGGEGAKRPVGPDGKSAVHFVGRFDAEGRPLVISTDKDGGIVVGHLKASPEGQSFAEAVQFETPNLKPFAGGAPKPATGLAKVAETVKDVATSVVTSVVPGAGAPPPAPPPPPAWGQDGWPALPRSAPRADAEWTGGEGAKRPIGPDGHSAVRFTGDFDANGRPIVFVEDTRTNEILVGKIKDAPGKTFAESVDFEISTLKSYSDAHIAPFEPGPPSNWERASNWTRRRTKVFGAALKQALSSRDALMSLKDGALGKGAAETVDTLSRFPISAVSFGMALGISAAYRLAFDYPNNPIAWSKYTEQMADPIGWISLAGFSVGMAVVLRAFEAAPKTFKTQLPIFLGSLGFGALIQVGIETFARDKDVSACMGFTNFRKTGNPFDNSRENPFSPRDPAACDRAYAKVTSGSLAIEAINNAIPNLAAIAVSGTIFYMLLYQIERSALLQRIFTAARVGSTGSPLGFIVQGSLSVGLTVLFLALSEKPQDVFMKGYANMRTAWAGRDGPLYAGNVKRAENDLFEVWERARQSGWKDPDVFQPTTQVCYDENRLGSKYYDCAAKNQLDFAGVLETYRTLNLQWRENQLRPSLSAYKDWMEKASAYGDLVAQTKTFYKDAVEKILYTRAHPEAPAGDPKVFNMDNLKIKTTSTYLPPRVRGLLYNTPLLESYARSWKYVSTPRLEEYLAASMACGPEIEGQSEGGFLSGLGHFVENWVTFNSTPRQMIEDEQGLFIKTKGYKVVFHPPRLTTPLAGTTESICQKAWSSGWSKRYFPERYFWGAVADFAPPTLDRFEIMANGKAYTGLLGYVQDNVRPSVISPEGFNDFDSWWGDNVDRQDEALRVSMYEEFKKVVEGPFKAALKKPEYYWCDDSPKLAGTRLEKYMRRLHTPGDACGAQRSHRLAYGVMNNLRDQARLYIAMMVDMYVSNANVLTNPVGPSPAGEPRYPETVASAENAVIVPAQDLVKAYDGFVKALVDSTDDDQAQAAVTKLNESYNEFVRIVSNGGDTGLTFRGQPFKFGVEDDVVKVHGTGEIVTLPARPTMQTEWMNRLAVTLKQVMLEWSAYARIAALQ